MAESSCSLFLVAFCSLKIITNDFKLVFKRFTNYTQYFYQE
jgi:hypothetical protein